MHEPAHLSRRTIAAALPLAALAGVPAAAQSTPTSTDDSALLDLGRRWEAAFDAMKAHDREYDRLYSTMT